jgi:hypothetical protein
MPLLSWLEQTDLSTWVRESPSMFAYPTILFLHTVGLAFLVGPSIAIAARVLGLARGLPLSPMEKFYPIMWWGFFINVASGTALLMADATTKLINWDFYLKLAFVAIGMTALGQLRTHVFTAPSTDPQQGDTRAMSRRSLGWAVVLLASWMIVIAAGRFMAYLGPVSGAPALHNSF